jgi:two-component sensor histidine kinase
MAKVNSRSKQMGRRPAEGESISGYFRMVFKENPALLHSRSNDVLLERWLKDHPWAKEVPARVKQNLANIKSILRKKSRKKKITGGATEPAAPTTLRSVPSRGLESLEGSIDDCLTKAKNLDRESLDSIIKLLRRARNEVVWKLGQ